MLVGEIMSRGVDALSIDDSLQDAASIMRAAGIECMPVKNADRVVGLVSEHNITCRAVADGRDPRLTFVGAVMSRDFCRCFDDQDVEDAARIMARENIPRLVVVDHDDHAVGTLGAAELTRRAAPLPVARTIEALSDYYDWW